MAKVIPVRPSVATPFILFILILAACTSPAAAPSSPAVLPSDEPSVPSPTETPSEEPSPSPTEPAGHPGEGLALVRVADPSTGVSQVYVVEADGSLRQVTGVSGSLGASNPVWSPDGSQLAFGASKVGSVGIKGMVGVVNEDGSGERQLGEGDSMRWSPDGTRISFTEVDDVTAEPVSHYIVDVASGEITDLGHGYDARWLDDDRIVYRANEFGPDGALIQPTFILTLSTDDRERIAENATVYPSPDGSMVLLATEDGGVVSLAPADDLEAATELASGGSPLWSPDGTMVAVNYDFDEQSNPIWAVVDLDGETIQSGMVGSLPTWSRDGTRLALEVFDPDGSIIQVVEVETGEVIFETEGMQPAFRP